ncbi:unnamed protein product [Brassica oleracea var. botrytis]|uniref:Uncharacterized protein n=2 Tax=Brassica TaxID=3705 RepID=A0A3P6EGL5_BRAOL|nr:unnamed protein product [Brassica napus]VDD36636.1 unnamed protein product [Brassica oleracea]
MKVDLAQQKEIEDEENAEMNSITSVFSAASALTSEEEKRLIEEEDDDVNKDDDKLFESFFIKDLPPQCTLVDIIFKKFKDNESRLAEERSDPQMDPMIAKLYKG